MTSNSVFDNLLSAKVEKGAQALDTLVEKLNTEKEETIYNFLQNPGCEDVLWALLSMLSSKNIRMASNSAYVIGSLAETEEGSTRILSILEISGKKKLTALENLTQMLEVEDAETVMNAAGTLGTLAETDQGRNWMLKQSCIEQTMTNTTFLLGSENHWTASNSALVLARMTISEKGRTAILDHPRSKYILQRLIQSLGNDAAGRGMNSAFAVGRLLDTKVGKERLLNGPDTEKMITSLCRMLSKGDMGGAKNACFAISCLATDADGNQSVLSNNLFQDALNRLVLLLSDSDDSEACWFSAMTLKTMSTHKHGVLRLRQSRDVELALLKVQNRPQISKELEEEILTTLANLKKLSKPDPPFVEILGSRSVKVMWNRVPASSGFQVTYKVICDNKMVYKGHDLEYVINDLLPFTTYSIKLRSSTVGDDSPYSETVSVTTDEDTPSAPTFFRVMGATPTQLRLTWNAPDHHNGILRGYHLFLGDKLLESMTDMSFIISRLTPATHYTMHVCASTSKGMGDRATIQASTEELGAHAPEKPTVTVIGRNEVQVAWNPPSVPLGRFFRYELCMNDHVVYQGIDRFHRATGLTPDTEYIFVVVAITSEGRCASDPTKKKTPKDKSQIEPGHHQLKTHSFKAKEFQAMQEKSKSQTNLIPPIQKPKQKLKKRNSTINRPNSNISLSNASDISAITNGTWGMSANEHMNENQSKVNDDNGSMENQLRNKKKFHNAAVLGGPSLKAEYSPASTVTTRSGTDSLINEGENKAAKPSEEHVSISSRVASSKTTNSAPKMMQKPIDISPKEHGFDKENRRQTKVNSSTRNRVRLLRNHTMMKGRKVLKSDKELLSEMAIRDSKINDSKQNQHKLPETSNGHQRPYYPDIVSAIRNQYGHESTIEDDLKNGLFHQNLSDSPDSLNPEPGTARNGIDYGNELVLTKSTVPPIKSSVTRERPINENYFRDISKKHSSAHGVVRSPHIPKIVSKSSNHVIVKPSANSRYGIKYNVQSSGYSSSLESDHLSSIPDDGKIFQAQRSTILDIVNSDRRVASLSDRNLDSSVHSRSFSSRLKTPPKGYWSDHDVSPTRAKKKAPVLTPINYRTFQSAHRPTKSIRLESPMIAAAENAQWNVGESVGLSDNNRYKFIPTQWRTQPANLPSQTRSGNVHYRLEALNDRVKRNDPTDKRMPNDPSHGDTLQTLPSSDYSATLHRLCDLKASLPEDISASVHNLKTGSLLAALNYQNGYNNKASTQAFSNLPRTETGGGKIPKATDTSVLSPLSSSNGSGSSKSGSLSNPSTQSPHFRLTSSTSSVLRSPIPTASGYVISPSHSLSPLSTDSHVSHLQQQLTMVQGGIGDPV